MKREPDDTPSVLSPAPSSPASPTSDAVPATKKRKTASKSATKPPSGELTPEKKALLMDAIISAGYKALDMTKMATELGLNAKQLQNAFGPNRKGNLRHKAVVAVSGK
ncbi:uncharacterized protein LOC62_05G007238 [Vanrija pseudolonga]|uniref:Uncharacterized protein n=1 Tax=Vanrija pseudolonga TaxID=143232 RepID=A0AAF0YBH0_9TREE|nr:hypothetical protein LOC62_05G007238 [Vanrija pseudolonga]